MIRATLAGDHTHTTRSGVRVQVYKRGDQYLARGRYKGKRFGEQIGRSEPDAKLRLFEILNEIDRDSFVRSSERQRRPLAKTAASRLTLREVVNEFLVEKRKLRGRKTADTYRSRLGPVLDFAERPENRRRWPLASDVDRDFAVDLKAFLHTVRTTRNGRPGAPVKPLSDRQIVNDLECLRTALIWARRADVRKLPPEWSSPLTPEIVGAPPTKDPLRDDPVPLDDRVRLVDLMDPWQLCHLGLFLVLPLRPDEATGLLVEDVDFDKTWLRFGSRFGGSDFTKGRTSFRLPFPAEMTPLLRACIGGRAAGPLLRSREAFEGRGLHGEATSATRLVELLDRELDRAGRDEIQADNDRKQLFRRLLRKLGGVSKDGLAKACRALYKSAGVSTAATLYSLRSAVTTAMGRVGMPHLEHRYLTSHTTGDVLNAYVSLDPVGAMRPYFQSVRPLLDAIAARADELGLVAALPKRSETAATGTTTARLAQERRAA